MATTHFNIHEDTTVIFGPPGTGKTTRLVNELEQMLLQGTQPNMIGYLAFTNKAADVVKQKVKQFGNDFPNIRTIHSFAYRNIPKKKLLNYFDRLRIKKLTGIDFLPTTTSSDEEPTMMGKASWIYMAVRSGSYTMDEACQAAGVYGVTQNQLEEKFLYFDEYKKKVDKIDFSDMLYNYIDEGDIPILDYLIVDEAQDLSFAQWEVIKKLATKTQKRVIVAGDDDQSIFRWAGADTTRILNIKARHEVLGQTYRFGSRIKELADHIISKVKVRKEKIWLPNPKQVSEIYPHASLEQLDLKEGTWLLLARTKSALPVFEQLCRKQNIFFYSQTSETMTEENVYPIFLWNKLKAGGEITKTQARQVLRHIAKGDIEFEGRKELPDIISMRDLVLFGLRTTGDWFDVLNISKNVANYIKRCEDNGEDISSEPRVKISTMHNCKGDEADNVCIYTGFSHIVERNQNTDDEHKVWYVGITRAKKRLYLLDTGAKYEYTF
jgi:DNA helicase-2/ATP-dependent DNA helicase PcrA